MVGLDLSIKIRERGKEMRFELMSEFLDLIYNHWKDTANPSKDEKELAEDYYIILKNFIFRKPARS